MKGDRPTGGSGDASPRKRDDEPRLIQRAKQGDKQSIADLYRRYVDVVYRYVWMRVHDDMLAEDLTSQVFLKALEGLPTYEPGGSPFIAWLYRIAHARIVDHWRRQERRLEVAPDDSLQAPEPHPQELLDMEADWAEAVALLAQLTDDQQDVLILRFVGDMNVIQVAETLGKTVGATKAIQHRALASLARLLQQQGGAR